MKRLIIFLVLFSLFSSLIVLAEESPSVGITEGDKEKLDNLTKNIPINDDGSFNSSLLNPVKSKAEQRIDAINKWFVDNAPWLSIVFGMIPAISWLFAVNIYFMLLFLVILVLNSSKTFGFLSGNKPWIFGLVLYLILLVTKIYVMLAQVVLDLIEKLWLVSVILAIIVIILLILLLRFAPWMLISIAQLFQKDKMGQILEKAEVNEKELHAKVKGMNEKV